MSRGGVPFVPRTVPVCPGHRPAENVYVYWFFSCPRKRGVEFKGGSLHDGFGGFDGLGGSGEHLALLLLVLQTQEKEAAVTVLTVLAVMAVMAVSVVTATLLKLNPPFPSSKEMPT